jgi:hypothetical protein
MSGTSPFRLHSLSQFEAVYRGRSVQSERLHMLSEVVSTNYSGMFEKRSNSVVAGSRHVDARGYILSSRTAIVVKRIRVDSRAPDDAKLFQ